MTSLSNGARAVAQWRASNLRALALAGEPARGSAARFARLCGLRPSALSALMSNQRAMGAVLARRIERAAGLKEGYLDNSPLSIEAMDIEELEYLQSAQAQFRAGKLK